MRRGLRSFLAECGHHTLAETGEGSALPKLVARRRPDFVVTEVDLEGVDGIEAVRRIATEMGRRKPRILVFSGRSSEDAVLRSFAAGADGFALKTLSGEALLEALDRIRRGERYLCPELATPFVMRKLATNEVSDPLSDLTPREREVLRLVAEGKTNKQAAAVLGVAVKTVEAHRANLMRKLDLHDLSSLVRFAIRVGVLPPDGGTGV